MLKAPLPSAPEVGAGWRGVELRRFHPLPQLDDLLMHTVTQVEAAIGLAASRDGWAYAVAATRGAGPLRLILGVDLEPARLVAGRARTLRSAGLGPALAFERLESVGRLVRVHPSNGGPDRGHRVRRRVRRPGAGRRRRPRAARAEPSGRPGPRSARPAIGRPRGAHDLGPEAPLARTPLRARPKGTDQVSTGMPCCSASSASSSSRLSSIRRPHHSRPSSGRV